MALAVSVDGCVARAIGGARAVAWPGIASPPRRPVGYGRRGGSMDARRGYRVRADQYTLCVPVTEKPVTRSFHVPG